MRWYSGGRSTSSASPATRASDDPGREPDGIQVGGYARVHNRGALLRTLRIGAPPEDDRLLLAAILRQHGTGALRQVAGAFGCAIWDARRERLIALRDPMGERPVYVRSFPDGVAVASRMSLLRSLSQVECDLDDRWIADYLLGRSPDADATIYADIRRLAAGHVLVADADGISVRPDASLAAPAADENGSMKSDAACEQAYRRCFRAAVRGCLSPDATVSEPVGTLLSGGLDSSSITCAVREERRGRAPVPAYSLVFDRLTGCDERRYIQAVVESGGIRSHIVAADALDPAFDLDRSLRAVEEPFTTPNLFLHRALFDAARANGHTVLLDGFLGDQVVGHGSRYLVELAARGRVVEFARELHAAARRLGPRRRTIPSLLRQYAWTPLVADPLRQRRARRRLDGMLQYLQAPLVRRDFLRSTGWPERARGHRDLNPPPRRFQALHRHELRDPRLALALETAVKLAATRGIDPRFPFADRRLVEMCLALPPTQKLRDGMTRSVARRALSDLLPPAVRHRTDKANLGPAFRHALLETAADDIDRILAEDGHHIRRYVDVDATRAQFSDCRAGKASPEPLSFIWRATLLARWMALHHNTPVPALLDDPPHRMQPPMSVASSLPA